MENLDFTKIDIVEPLSQYQVISIFNNSIPRELIKAINKLYLKGFKGLHYVYININDVKKELQDMNFDVTIEKLFTDGFFNLSYYYKQYGYNYKHELYLSSKNQVLSGYIEIQFYIDPEKSRK